MYLAIKESIKTFLFQFLFYRSLESSIQQQNRVDLKSKLGQIVPDLTKQYTMTKFEASDKYHIAKIRNLHSFQIDLLLKAISKEKNKKHIFIADIGDSSGTHMKYIQNMAKDLDKVIEAVSINLDPIAIEKIQNLGLKAILCRAEDLHKSTSFQADIFSAFEVLEHFFDPISFLKKMSSEAKCKQFVITVPYLKKSRVGLQYIKNDIHGKRFAENTHIFELSPEDWDLIFKFSGWRIAHSEIYRQYPSANIFAFTKFLWRKFDFEGFYGVILEKDETYSSMYQNW